jgi:hypothetical protein
MRSLIGIAFFSILFNMFSFVSMSAQEISIPYNKKKLTLNAESYKVLDSICALIKETKRSSIRLTSYYGKSKVQKHFKLDTSIHHYIALKTGRDPVFVFDYNYNDGENVKIEITNRESVPVPPLPNLKSP